ncbi:UDP-glucose/GDP-mannose dehydrogenase family protein [Candidatus Phaeomarinobacter ectocarpi]|uniref:UDP-glucose 6-dehydrogenase n=1 Tax=Candidatus Phaeomarinibacter ectocarpi TaxID=1458461 RepID=X5MCL6_9HYPH|nr:nucleotide sugar dehydrogenase [Candidatus Phaeomarinobacter ectocarpi]CDO59312.1 UDP-glucose/GDP-mannose dehydrogenase family protein [Candidatus Phaeomarinobacter ectocarpi]
MTSTDTLPVIGFAGMTHLGLNSAVGMAEKGFNVVCFDPDAALIGQLEKGEMPVLEPDLPELAAKNKDSITYSSDLTILERCDVLYVAPDVPVTDDGVSDLADLDALLEKVIPAIREDAVLVNLSQVPPGFTRARTRPGLNMFYQVETLIFGRAIERALYPERYIIGCPDPDAPLPDAFRKCLEAYDCPILPMRYESAELCKISINCCLVASISVANTLSELCEGIGADWSEIAPALKLDRRIGQYSYLSPGLGIGGSNLIRDLITVTRFAEETGSDASVIAAWIRNSAYRKEWALRTLHERVLSSMDDPLVAVLGLSYKENTHSTKNSPAFAMIENLHPYRVTAFDPVVKTSAAPHPAPIDAADPLDCANGADVVCIMTPWDDFKSIDPAKLADVMAGKWVLDPYRVLDAKACSKAGLSYLTLGVSDA